MKKPKIYNIYVKIYLLRINIMAGQEKVMGFADLEHFLKQQFPESNKVNILLEQISKSKVEMEKELGEEIVGEAKVKIAILEDELPWDDIEEEPEINEDYIKEE